MTSVPLTWHFLSRKYTGVASMLKGNPANFYRVDYYVHGAPLTTMFLELSRSEDGRWKRHSIAGVNELPEGFLDSIGAAIAAAEK